MKHLKTYEDTIQKEPNLNDYVSIKLKNKYIINRISGYVLGNNPIYINFVNSHLGKLIQINLMDYCVEFEECIPESDNDDTLYVTKEDIDFFSPNKKDVKVYMKANKFNL